MHSTQDTIAAIATPLGEGAIGVIRLSGPRALPILQTIFQPLRSVDLTFAPPPSCHVGKIIAGSTIDHVVVTVFRAPHSYTGDDVIEISAHGSVQGLQQILQLCLRQGARLAAPGEFTQRAFLNGKMDLTQAEAVADLIRAKTAKAQTAAMAQLEGHLARQIRVLRDQLVPLLAHVEVGLDHADEDHEFLRHDQLLAACHRVSAEVDRLLASAHVGKILREGLRVALVGRPNVGKSSLLNALLKEERAIVTPIAGTTRDTLEETVDWEGLPVVLIDTAGVREASNDPVERLGIERTRQALQQADLVLCLFDRSVPLTSEDHAVLKECLSKPRFWVLNKVDLPASWTEAEFHRLNGQAPTIPVSSKTGEGLASLIQQVKTLALQEKASLGDAAWGINARHHQALERVQQALTEASRAAQGKAYDECVALELKTAMNALGEIVGEISTDDLLEQIFSTFCIGK